MFLGSVDDASLKIWEANVAAQINDFLAERDLLQYRTFGYGQSFGRLSHFYGREAGLELREDIDTALEPGMVISMEPMLTIADGSLYRGRDVAAAQELPARRLVASPVPPDLFLSMGQMHVTDRALAVIRLFCHVVPKRHPTDDIAFLPVALEDGGQLWLINPPVLVDALDEGLSALSRTGKHRLLTSIDRLVLR